MTLSIMRKWVLGGALGGIVAVAVSCGWRLASVETEQNVTDFVLERPLEQVLEARFNKSLESCQNGMSEGTDPWQPGGCVDQAYASSEGAFRAALPADVWEQIEQRSASLDEVWHTAAQNQTLAAEARTCFADRYPGLGDDADEVADRYAGQLAGAPPGVGYAEHIRLSGADASPLTETQQREAGTVMTEAREAFGLCHTEYRAAFDAHLLARDQQLVTEFTELRDAARALITADTRVS